MALIWSAAAPPEEGGRPSRGADAVGGRGGGRERERERRVRGGEGGWCVPSVTLHPPGTALPGVVDDGGGFG